MPAEKLPIRRILVAMDASPQSLAALSAAVELGVKLEAQLLGLFVEDIELLRLASSPYARELLLPTAKIIPLESTGMERKLKVQAEQVRKALATAADQAKVKWTFRVVRGRVPSELIAAAAECDLVALGWRGWSLGKQSHMGSTALAAIGESTPALFLSAHGTFADLPILVWYDGTPSSKRGLLAAVHFVRIGSRKLIVLLPLSKKKSSNNLQQQIMDLVKANDIRLSCQLVDCSDELSLRNALRQKDPCLLVLTGKEPFPRPDRLLALLESSDISALLLGEGSAFKPE